MFIWIDETAKDRNAGRRRRGWAYRGKATKARKSYQTWRDTRYTFIAALNILGFVYDASTCVLRKKEHDDLFNVSGTIDQEAFEHYVERYLVPSLGRFDLGEANSIVIMDNCPTHIGFRVREMIEGEGAVLIYLPVNSPDFNPIEDCFHVYKSALKRDQFDPSLTCVEMAHLRAMHALTPEKVQNEYRHLGIIRNVPVTYSEKQESEVAAAVLTIFSAFHHIKSSSSSNNA